MEAKGVRHFSLKGVATLALKALDGHSGEPLQPLVARPDLDLNGLLAHPDNDLHRREGGEGGRKEGERGEGRRRGGRGRGRGKEEREGKGRERKKANEREEEKIEAGEK